MIFHSYGIDLSFLVIFLERFRLSHTQRFGSVIVRDHSEAGTDCVMRDPNKFSILSDSV